MYDCLYPGCQERAADVGYLVGSCNVQEQNPFCESHRNVGGWHRCTTAGCERWAVSPGGWAYCGKHGGQDYLHGSHLEYHAAEKKRKLSKMMPEIKLAPVRVKIPFFDMEQVRATGAACLSALDGVIVPLEIPHSELQQLLHLHETGGAQDSTPRVMELTGCKSCKYMPRYINECGADEKLWREGLGWAAEELPEVVKEKPRVTLDCTPSWWPLAGQSIGAESQDDALLEKRKAAGFAAIQKLASLTKAQSIKFSRHKLWVETLIAEGVDAAAWQEELRLELETLNPRPRARMKKHPKAPEL